MEQNKKRSGQKKQVRERQQKVKQIDKIEPAKDNSMKYLCLFIVIIAFTFAFMLLINKQNNEYLNDLNERGFSIHPEVGKVIVARDTNAIYPKYYVVYTNEDNYSIYVYNYYETVSQYELEYNRLIDKIVDYSERDKMIRYLYGRGYGTYNEVLNNLSMLVDSNNLKIY